MIFKHKSLWNTALFLATVGLIGCTRSKENWNTQTIHAADGAVPSEAPSMVHEADLPEGFPAPGPEGKIVLKTYPKHRAAVNRAGSGESSNRLFRPLFNHIQENKIAMTAPVEMTYPNNAVKPASMAFMYANTDIGKVGKQKGIEVVDVPEKTYLSIGVRGGYTTQRLLESREALLDWLAKNTERYKADGPVRYLGYNSPFVPSFMKYGEVQIPVRPK